MHPVNCRGHSGMNEGVGLQNKMEINICVMIDNLGCLEL